jgi:hypothetical protein
MPAKPTPARRGVQRLLTIERDAAVILNELCAGEKTHGRLVSDLLRTEKRIREERERWRVERAREKVGLR